MPVLPCPRFYINVFLIFEDQVDAADLILQHKPVYIAREQQIAASAENKRGRGSHSDQVLQLILCCKGGEIMGRHIYAESIISLEGDIFRDKCHDSQKY